MLKGAVTILALSVLSATLAMGQQLGIYTSSAELATIPMSGPAWQAVQDAANQSTSSPVISNQDDNTDQYVLAAGIVYARTGNTTYRDKVIAACSTLANAGKPAGRTLAWARNTGAYAIAADLVGYRDPKFQTWLRNMAEVYVAEDGTTLKQMFFRRPNNWGMHAFGALTSIYRYLQDSTSLTQIRDYWVQGVIGPNPGFKYGDLSWQANSLKPVIINPTGAVKQGLNIDGVLPDDQRRGGSFSIPPGHTGYPWEAMQGIILGARVLQRAGMPVWNVGNNAIYRAAYRLEVAFDQQFGGWAATGDDEWMLPFIDKAYGSNFSNDRTHTRLWQFGKNAGFGYVTLAK